MKQPVILLCLLFLLTTSGFASDDKRLEFLVKEFKYNQGVYPDLPRAEVLLELKNRTDDTLVFLTNTCAHSGLYNVDGEGTSYGYSSCDITDPIFIVIVPHSTYLDTITVGLFHLKKTKSFRVGINLVEPAEKRDPHIAWREKDPPKETLWTKPIEIK